MFAALFFCDGEICAADPEQPGGVNCSVFEYFCTYFKKSDSVIYSRGFGNFLLLRSGHFALYEVLFTFCLANILDFFVFF